MITQHAEKLKGIINLELFSSCFKEYPKELHERDVGFFTKKVLNKAWEIYTETSDCSEEYKKEVFKELAPSVSEDLTSFFVQC